jgi:hypothetical protein
VPNDDYTLSIRFENNERLEFPMVHLLCTLRFSPLREHKAWERVEVYPTHLEWKEGTFPVSLNIEEIEEIIYKQ